MRFAIVASSYHKEYCDALVSEAEAELQGHEVTFCRVPGSFEIPLQVKRLAHTGQYNAILALGVVWQGETLHAQEILRAVTDSLMRIALEEDVPVIHEVLSVKSEAEVRERTMGELSRGREGARTALAVAELTHGS
ncbi:6,7-dimethyl-8-ribityllumazine synthase [Methylacidimicrobium tartarophylax]|uniref:6,7-dimethyl-8-ribityllumazine synthase n=1 Tax=Methylacidimicrobium tartarophylax TaxID=1041768 RepID=A0A5E6MJ30_9BACT|nr:6,7-dimethyl-8-ribityllumazine synthase [Methylacidimicrobium tartarophylax]VVM08339.1 6,7-dimethyl-8-ribityllumazine synthase [Methylacidimicrobium tartarophylax]